MERAPVFPASKPAARLASSSVGKPLQSDEFTVCFDHAFLPFSFSADNLVQTRVLGNRQQSLLRYGPVAGGSNRRRRWSSVPTCARPGERKRATQEFLAIPRIPEAVPVRPRAVCKHNVANFIVRTAIEEAVPCEPHSTDRSGLHVPGKTRRDVRKTRGGGGKSLRRPRDCSVLILAI